MEKGNEKIVVIGSLAMAVFLASKLFKNKPEGQTNRTVEQELKKYQKTFRRPLTSHRRVYTQIN